MKNIVFQSLYRKLSKQPLILEEQFHFYRNERAKEEVRKGKNRKRILEYFSTYIASDTINVRMPFNGQNAIQHIYPEDSDWIYNDKNDMLVKSVILMKDIDIEGTEASFLLKIVALNHNNAKVLGYKRNIGDTITVELNHNIIEPVQ